ncbi:MAG: carboxypeptidase-like regulatory domain-containing protein [Bacteroidales bacterium]
MKTKKMILLTCISFLGLQLIASDKPNFEVTKNACISGTGTMITGQVVDKITHEPLVGAKVKLVDCNLEVYTDFDGNFSFDRIGEGEYILQIEYVSYETRYTTINLSNQGKEHNALIALKNARN